MAVETLVVDTSVVVKWFSDEELTETALDIRRLSIENVVEVFVPDLLLYELSNVLRYNGHFDSEDVRAAVDSVLALNVEVMTPTPELLADAIDAAHGNDLTVYDATYVALAEALDCRVVAADEEVARLEHAVGLSEFRPTAG